MDFGAVVHAIFLQLDVLTDIIYLGPKGYLVLLGVGVHVLGQFHELHERRLGPRHVGQHQPVKSVQRIEEEMGVDLDFVKSQFGLFSLVLRGLPFDDLAVKLGKRAHGETECRDDDVEKPNGPLMKDHQTCAGCCVEFLRSIRPGPHPGHDLPGNLEAVAGNKPRHNESDGDNGNGGDNLPTAAQQSRNGIIAVCEIDDIKPPHE